MLIGYARILTGSQNLDLQIDALTKFGYEKIYQEMISGAKASRPELDKLIAELRPEETVVIWKLDRLGRSLKHLVELVSYFNSFIILK